MDRPQPLFSEEGRFQKKPAMSKPHPLRLTRASDLGSDLRGPRHPGDALCAKMQVPCAVVHVHHGGASNLRSGASSPEVCDQTRLPSTNSPAV